MIYSINTLKPYNIIYVIHYIFNMLDKLDESNMSSCSLTRFLVNWLIGGYVISLMGQTGQVNILSIKEAVKQIKESSRSMILTHKTSF